jgi:hypothetical protein
MIEDTITHRRKHVFQRPEGIQASQCRYAIRAQATGDPSSVGRLSLFAREDHLILALLTALTRPRVLLGAGE